MNGCIIVWRQGYNRWTNGQLWNRVCRGDLWHNLCNKSIEGENDKVLDNETLSQVDTWLGKVNKNRGLRVKYDKMIVSR